jgi:pimeloyl-ACP methyl ester carboxylesterase
MLHGITVSFAGNFGAWGWIERLTAKGLQVVGLDFRGHGRSEKSADPQAYGTKNLAGDVIALLDTLEIARASIVGYSLGSTVALHLLHTFPDRCARSALIATGDGQLGYPPYSSAEVMPQLCDAVSRSHFPTDLPDHVAAYWNFATHVGGDRASAAAAARAAYPPCSDAEAARISALVLVVSGENDLVLGTGARLAQALPQGKYLEIQNADHFSLSVDATVQTAVADFLAGSP